MNWSYLQIFIQSMGVEALIIGLYFLFIKKRNPLKIMAFVFMLNACTHPIVVFIIMKTGIYIQAILIAETFAWMSEAFCYRKKIVNNYREALLLSLIANIISWQMGPWMTLFALNLLLKALPDENVKKIDTLKSKNCTFFQPYIKLNFHLSSMINSKKTWRLICLKSYLHFPFCFYHNFLFRQKFNSKKAVVLSSAYQTMRNGDLSKK